MISYNQYWFLNIKTFPMRWVKLRKVDFAPIGKALMSRRFDRQRIAEASLGEAEAAGGVQQFVGVEGCGEFGPHHLVTGKCSRRATQRAVIFSPMKVEDLKGIVHSDPEIMGGTPVFVGTRVPLQNLIDYLEGGESIEDFLDGFPSVKREQVIAVIEAAKLKMLETV
jgi:uncharacterized protein (DUF433 family)